MLALPLYMPEDGKIFSAAKGMVDVEFEARAVQAHVCEGLGDGFGPRVRDARMPAGGLVRLGDVPFWRFVRFAFA